MGEGGNPPPSMHPACMPMWDKQASLFCTVVVRSQSMNEKTLSCMAPFVFCLMAEEKKNAHTRVQGD